MELILVLFHNSYEHNLFNIFDKLGILNLLVLEHIVPCHRKVYKTPAITGQANHFVI